MPLRVVRGGASITPEGFTMSVFIVAPDTLGEGSPLFLYFSHRLWDDPQQMSCDQCVKIRSG